MAVFIGILFAGTIPEDKTGGKIISPTFLLGCGLGCLLWCCMRDFVNFVRHPFVSLVVMVILFVRITIWGRAVLM